MATRMAVIAGAMVAVLAAGCGGGTPAPSAGAPTVGAPSNPRAQASSSSTAPPARSLAPTRPAPTASNLPALSVDELERIELADIDATVVCDPEPGQAVPGAGGLAISCSDAIALAVAAVRTVTPEPAVRLHVDLPDCGVDPCSDDDLSTAAVVTWTATTAYKVRLHARLGTVPSPVVVDAGARWPPAGDATAPEVTLPAVDGAPREVAEREPFPFCGRAELGEPASVLACFRAAVLDGGRAELIERVYPGDGEPALWIYRSNGTGPIVGYHRSEDGNGSVSWSRVEGAMILGIDASRWSFDPWDGTTEWLAP